MNDRSRRWLRREFVLESPYTLAFGAGVACALASIYLGVFLTGR